MKTWIKDIQDSGKLIIVADGSKYKVSTYDAYDTRFWSKLDNVTVAGGKMTNHSQRDKSVDVTRS